MTLYTHIEFLLKKFSQLYTTKWKLNVQKKKLEKLQTAFNQMHYKKIAKIVGIFATSCLVMHFCCGHNVRKFARGDCILGSIKIFICFLIKMKHSRKNYPM